MSGHSKWATTKRHKAAIDAKRGKLFSVMSKEISLAARNGGGDPEFNPRLRTCVAKAKAANMPAENVERAIKKGTGELPGVTYEEVTYEGYGPGGVGIIVEVTTDNKNRSASAVRSVFTKAGGSLTSPGALSYNFNRQGQFLIAAGKTTEENLMEAVLDAGAEDILNQGDHFEVRCPMSEFDAVSGALEKAGIAPENAEVAYIPASLAAVSDASTARKVLHLIEQLEDLEDVSHVYANYDIADDLLQQAGQAR